ncbi:MULTISPECIES: DUF3949 domain-containing protein [Bacillus cereus group]|uniref:DUF3949 domain-containing protein n=1 Tax=Bacillus cereus TaxID=1396 RepID=A0AA44TFC9_BACCE|nr:MULTISPECIES: DUF3949 domain-containing protein [Bacillus cereus group]PFA22433.1 DUF3949 domain-containing protein [Bacillus cereus]PFN05747.1 DUF3949 domain-containing protein [Bacillus cereus]PFO77410.1 DUF3949 domain-containing protein [Bacillus cereus]PFR20018.1 DUF3949 domain-containing protein [Bacillus cereus]PFS03679.1 DUF3949 domain-containing protein [Bacillus cereus]
MSSEFLFFGGVALFYFFLMIPIQYLYIEGLNEQEQRTRRSQQELYKNMSFEEEQLHFHVQGNPFNIPPAFVAYIILKIKNHKKASE